MIYVKVTNRYKGVERLYEHRSASSRKEDAGYSTGEQVSERRIALAVHQNSGFEYPGMLIYVMAMYAFYAMITAVRNVIKFRRYGSPVMSAAKDDLPSKQKGFQLGIDDYMVKPIELAELLLRVRTLLRRANIEMERKIMVGNLEMDADGMSAEVGGEEINLTTREFNILYKLLSYPKKTFSRAQLMDEFWGVDSDTSLRAVDVYVTKLRDKLSDCDGFKIVTVRGLGYKAVLM